VFPEFGFTDPASVLGALALYMALFVPWILALVGVSKGRRAGMWTPLALTAVVNIGLGLGTTLAVCPTPCRTLWPVGELWNWATTVSASFAAIALVRSLRSGPTRDA